MTEMLDQERITISVQSREVSVNAQQNIIIFGVWITEIQMGDFLLYFLLLGYSIFSYNQNFLLCNIRIFSYVGPHSGLYLECKTRNVGQRMEAIMIQSMKQGEIKHKNRRLE